MGVAAAVWKDIQDWLHQPFRPNMDWVQLFLAIGLVVVMIGLWSRILVHLQTRLE